VGRRQAERERHNDLHEWPTSRKSLTKSLKKGSSSMHSSTPNATESSQIYQLSSICAPGSTIQQYFCSREHNPAVFELPGAQFCSIGAPGSTIKRYLCSRSTIQEHLCSWEHKQAVFVLPGAQSSNICAPGSTIQRYLCSREFVLPGAQLSSICVAGSTLLQYLCSREHNPAVFMLPGAHTNSVCVYCLCSREGAQSRDICAPGSTIQQYLCSRQNKQAVFVLPGAQSSSRLRSCNKHVHVNSGASRTMSVAQTLRAATAQRRAPRPRSLTSSTCVRVPMGPSRTTSTRARVPRKGVPPPTFAPTSIPMVSNLRRFATKLASQAPTGTTLHLSTHSSWPPPNSGLAQFAVTVMPMPIPTLMTMPQALMHPMIVTEFLLPLWGAYRVCFFFSLCFLRASYVESLSLTTSLRYQDSRLEIS
jgi:hypothetical protein